MGMVDRLADVADPRHDLVGLQLEEEHLPQRIRGARKQQPKPRILSTAVNEDDGTASLALAMDVAGYFELSDPEARDVAGTVGRVVAAWRAAAAGHGLSKAAIDRMASAFERHTPFPAHSPQLR